MTLTQELMIAAISAAGVIGGLLIGFLGALLKQWKKLLTEIKNTTEPIETAYESLKTDLSKTQNAIILAQSKDPEARQAVVELLSNAKAENVVSAAKAITSEIKKEVEEKKEILKKVASDYTPVD